MVWRSELGEEVAGSKENEAVTAKPRILAKAGAFMPGPFRFGIWPFEHDAWTNSKRAVLPGFYADLKQRKFARRRAILCLKDH